MSLVSTDTTIVSSINPKMHEGEPRILDTDLAARLGFDRPRDIRKLIARYEADLDRLGVRATVAQTSSEKGGRPTTATHLNRRQAIFITAKSETPTATDITIEIIERFDAYERGAATPAQPAIPQTLPEALRLAAEIEEKRIVAEARVRELEPQAAALARISHADGEFGLTEAAKLIQVNPRKFTDYLDTHRWRYTRGKTKLAYQDKIDAGYMRNKTYCYRDSNGEEQVSNTIRITAKGLVKLAQLVPGAIQPPAVHLAPEGTAPVPFAKAPEPAS